MKDDFKSTEWLKKKLFLVIGYSVMAIILLAVLVYFRIGYFYKHEFPQVVNQLNQLSADAEQRTKKRSLEK